MGIGLAKQDLRVEHYSWAIDETHRRIGTQELARLFGIPEGFHLFIDHILAIAANGETMEIFYDAFQRSPTINEFSEMGTGGHKLMPSGRHQVVIGNTQIGEHYKPCGFEVYDSIDLHKATSSWDFNLEIYYTFLPGAMMWLDEWAERLRDKSNAPFSHIAGRVYRQVGDYYQVNKRNLV